MPTLRTEQHELPDVGDDYTEQDPEDGFIGHNPDPDDNENYTVEGVLAKAEEQAKARDKEAKAREKEAKQAEKDAEHKDTEHKES